jgi:hypothetical protein
MAHISFLAYVNDVNIVGKNINTIEKYREALLDASMEVGLEVNPEKTNYTVSKKCMQLSQYSVCLQTGRSRFDPQQRQRIFPLASVPSPALRPTQALLQWVPGVLSPRSRAERA